MLQRCQHFLRLASLIAVTLMVLAGCTLQLAYVNLDRLVIRWVDGKVDLTSEQKTLVRRALDENLSWHCAAHLPQYSSMLNQLGQDLSNDEINVDTLVAYQDQLTEFGQELIEVSIEPATQLLASLSESQVNNLLSSFDESNQELIERLSVADIRKVQAERADRMERRLSRLMGRLNSQQQDRVAQWSVEYQMIEGHQLAYANTWQSQLQDALTIRESQPDVFAASIERLFEPTRGWDDGYRKAVDSNQALTLQLVADLLKLATPRQKERLMGKLEDYASDFDALSCSSKPELASLN